MDIELKSKRLLDIYDDDKCEIDFVREQIVRGNYTMLNNSVSIGNVYKVIYEGDLKSCGYEKAYLYLPTGTGIKEHIHTEDIEKYTLIYGIMSFNNECNITNECLIGCSHGVDIVDEDTIIKTLKINKRMIITSQLNNLDEKLYIKRR